MFNLLVALQVAYQQPGEHPRFFLDASDAHKHPRYYSILVVMFLTKADRPTRLSRFSLSALSMFCTSPRLSSRFSLMMT
jgi:hypothetical protein